MRMILLQIARAAYELGVLPLMLGTLSAQKAHDQALHLCAWFDGHPALLEMLRGTTLPVRAVSVGGVDLPSPLILAAGFLKGTGFSSERDALEAVQRGVNIVPGWHSIPTLVGAVEFGSFTRYPRLGNEGTTLWRNVGGTRSLQNRVGLRNSGAKAAAEFLALHRPEGVFGINIAVSPGVSDLAQETAEVMEALAAFLERGVHPVWFTLNLSCPNTEDDSTGNQTEDKAHHLCSALVPQLDGIPLWVKISPNLSLVQRSALMRVFAETGVRAVVATNTLPQAAPDHAMLTAGVSGNLLFEAALNTVRSLLCEKEHQGYPVDVVACGGVLDGATYHAYRQLGVQAVQYWSALVYRGPLAAALILNEAEQLWTSLKK
jgi:dihydroorotate dehydrogenase